MIALYILLGIVILIVIVALLFIFTTIPYSIILHRWNTKSDTEGIVHPFLKMVLYETKSGYIPKGLSDHENVHLEQINTLGSWTFVYEYTKELIKNGYEKNRFEVEARAKSGGDL